MTTVGVEDGADITGRRQVGGDVIGKADEYHEILERTSGEMPKVVVGVGVGVEVVVDKPTKSELVLVVAIPLGVEPNVVVVS